MKKQTEIADQTGKYDFSNGLRTHIYILLRAPEINNSLFIIIFGRDRVRRALGRLVFHVLDRFNEASRNSVHGQPHNVNRAVLFFAYSFRYDMEYEFSGSRCTISRPFVFVLILTIYSPCLFHAIPFSKYILNNTTRNIH